MQTKKPKLTITKISAKPWVSNGQGGWSSSCHMNIEMKNPSLSENEICAIVIDPKSSKILAQIENMKLPKLATATFRIEFGHENFMSEEDIKSFIGKKLFLEIKDIHGNRAKKKFIFASTD